MVGRTNVIGAGRITTKSVFSFTRGDNGTVYNFDETSASSSVSGVYNFYKSGNDWEFYALVSGTLNVPSNKELNVDLFLLGGGYNGNSGVSNISSQYQQYMGGTVYWCTTCRGGFGGNGGRRKTENDVVLKGSCAVTCGGAGASSAIGDYSSSVNGSSSGSNANGGYCFGDSNAQGPDGLKRLVGAGGGSGATSMTDGTTVNKTNAQNGGTYGGGAGGDAYGGGGGTWAYKGGNGGYWGAGGGGGGAWGNSAQSTSSDKGGKAAGGSGYKGFVAMRNKR